MGANHFLHTIPLPQPSVSTAIKCQKSTTKNFKTVFQNTNPIKDIIHIKFPLLTATKSCLQIGFLHTLIAPSTLSISTILNTDKILNRWTCSNFCRPKKYHYYQMVLSTILTWVGYTHTKTKIFQY